MTTVASEAATASAAGWLDQLVSISPLLTTLIAGLALWYSASQVKHLRDQVKLLREQAATSEKLAKMRATIDVVLHENADEKFQQCVKGFGRLRDEKQSFAQYACGNLQDHAAQNDLILPVINSYEFMAAGIRTGAFDESIYRRMRRSSVIRDWHAVSGYVGQLRHQHSNRAIFVEFESLAKQWESTPENKAD